MRDSSGKRVKIVCTLGPASSSPEKIKELIEAGMDVARLNFSHGDHSFHSKLIRIIRDVSKETKKRIAIMQDLQGPKIRVGKLDFSGADLKSGQTVLIYPEGGKPSGKLTGDHSIPMNIDILDPISLEIVPNARVLFDDGKMIAKVKEVQSPELLLEVKVGGVLKSHKGMNLPGTPLPIPSCTDKDWEDLKFGLSQGVDIVALSFVRSDADISQVRDFILKKSKARPSIYAKIEREEAIEHADSIIYESDGLLIARGDMAVEVGAEHVPIIQKRLIQACAEVGVPIITATQMLESMIDSPTPTRAEANDVANAVFDGTDAVMLSGETAAGNYPIETVKTMVRIIEEAEQTTETFSIRPEVLPMPGSIVDSIEFSAARIAGHVGAKAIICVTHSGKAARTVSKYRPETQIIAVMDQEDGIRRLAPIWGVNGLLIPEILSTDDIFGTIERLLLENGFVVKGDQIVITAGVPTLRKGTTNMVKVHEIKGTS